MPANLLLMRKNTKILFSVVPVEVILWDNKGVILNLKWVRKGILSFTVPRNREDI